MERKKEKRKEGKKERNGWPFESTAMEYAIYKMPRVG